MKPLHFLIILSLSTALKGMPQQSVLAEGNWVKMTFSSPGVYKIDRPTLAAMGFDINTLDPRNLKVYGIPGGMLPQENSRYTSLQLQELAIQVPGEADGTMGPEDYLLFYVDGPDKLEPAGSTYQVIKNLYAEQVHYFITLSRTRGKRLKKRSSIRGKHLAITFYDRIISHEKELFNILGSGREWYGEKMTTEAPLTFQYRTENLAADKDILLSVTGMAQSFTASSFEISLAAKTLGKLNFTPIPNTRYGIKGNEQNRIFRLNTRDFTSSNALKLAIRFNKKGQSNATGYLNRFVLDLPTALTYTNAPFNFRSKASLAQSLSTFQITGNTGHLQVWDVTDPISPSNRELEKTGNKTHFGALSGTLREYSLFADSDVPVVSVYEAQSNQNLFGMAVPDLLIVTNELLEPQAQRLANFRKKQDALEVAVVTTQQVYNEFSGGRQDISAIRNLARHLKNRSNRFKYLLLFGKGSYDYKDRIPNNSNLVPTYEARNSLHPLRSYSSDDYFGFLDENEGLWAESSSGDHPMDIGTGRIPATTLAQATTAVNKIIAYQTDPLSLGDWRSRLVFLADDGDLNIHQKDADRLATLIDTTYQEYNVTKLYLDYFKQELRANGEFSPEAVNALLDEVEKGALVINFTGHGAETGWTQEQILTTKLMDDWDNSTRLPLLVTATCEFGRNDNPTVFSGAEKMMFKPDGGALALVTTSRPVFSSSNYDLSLAFYKSILEPENGRYPRLGDIIRFTKNNSLRGSFNRNFILLGDPGMRLAYPKNQIRLRSINGNPVNATRRDTLKALQSVSITGVVESNDRVLSSFNGVVRFELLDKSNRVQTKGTDSEVFQFLQRNSTLFSGSASVTGGKFRVEFVVPKNINYQFGSGKMTFYATEKNSHTDALGASVDFLLGGTDKKAPTDRKLPQIRAFLNDTTKVDRYYVKPDADLVLLLEDESGINISKSGIGQNISALLNDSATYILNDFYTTKVDDFSKGSVRFPLRGLPLGRNRLRVKAWDTHNNANEAELEFYVTNKNSNTISKINAYPNPFINRMTFAITHNGAGQHTELVVEIFNQKGEKVTSIHKAHKKARNTTSIAWDGTDNTGSPLPPGVYLYNILLKIENAETVHSVRQRLIISN